MNILTDRALPTPRVAPHSFTGAEWTLVLGHLAQVIGPEAFRYADIPAAKLVAAIGYLAGSEDPDRFAVSNLLTFHAATKARALFNHRPSDDADVLRRLATIQFGALANRKVVEYGMTILALISLGDHEHDRETDRLEGKYNPIAEGRWSATHLRSRLNSELKKNLELKDLFNTVVGQDLSILNWWAL